MSVVVVYSKASPECILINVLEKEYNTCYCIRRYSHEEGLPQFTDKS
jgi:hypothetical protein